MILSAYNCHLKTALFLRYLIYATAAPLCYHYGHHHKLAAIIAHRIHPKLSSSTQFFTPQLRIQLHLCPQEPTTMTSSCDPSKPSRSTDRSTPRCK